MKQALDKYGIAMPAFGKIGGLLAGEVGLLSSFGMVVRLVSLRIAFVVFT